MSSVQRKPADGTARKSCSVHSGTPARKSGNTLYLCFAGSPQNGKRHFGRRASCHACVPLSPGTPAQLYAGASVLRHVDGWCCFRQCSESYADHSEGAFSEGLWHRPQYKCGCIFAAGGRDLYRGHADLYPGPVSLHHTTGTQGTAAVFHAGRGKLFCFGKTVWPAGKRDQGIEPGGGGALTCRAANFAVKIRQKKT